MRKKFDKIIKKSIQAVREFHEKDTPKIIASFHYGAYNNDPHFLSIIYVFEKDTELQYAKDSGLSDKIEKETIKALIDNGYPESAFEVKNIFDPLKVTVDADRPEQSQQIFDIMGSMRATVSFISDEDVKNKADGNYYVYLH